MKSYYSLSESEIDYIKKNIRGNELRLGFAVQLKVFQKFYYFPDLSLIPLVIVDHIKRQLSFLSAETTLNYQHDSALYRHRHMICNYLSVIRWKENNRKKNNGDKTSARRQAVAIALNAAQTLNQPADIINVVIEILRKDHYELPSFPTLSRLVKHAREQVNRIIFQSISEKLSIIQKGMLEALLITRPDYQRTGFNGLKQLPQKPSITHFKELIKHHQWLMSLGNLKPLLDNISAIKLKQFGVL